MTKHFVISRAVEQSKSGVIDATEFSACHPQETLKSYQVKSGGVSYIEEL